MLLWTERARSAGIAVTLTVCDGGVHVYPLVPTPEGHAAAREIITTLTSAAAATTH